MMQWNYGNTSRNFRRIVEAVGSRRFKVLWCPADNLRTINGAKLEFEYTPIGEEDVEIL